MPSIRQLHLSQELAAQGFLLMFGISKCCQRLSVVLSPLCRSRTETEKLVVE